MKHRRISNICSNGIPIHLLCELLNIHDLKSLQRTNQYFKAETYLKAKPTVKINNYCDGIKIIKQFKYTKLIGSDINKNEQLRQLPSLTSLRVFKNPECFIDKKMFATNYGFEFLTNLTELDLSFDRSVTTAGISHLTKLKRLSLVLTSKIGRNKISLLSNLTNLTDLNLEFNDSFREDALIYTPTLKYLNLTSNKKISKISIAGLTYLNLSDNGCLTDESLCQLINVQSLNLVLNRLITDAGMASLINLTDLNISMNNNISDLGLLFLTNLRTLDMSETNKITNAGISKMTNLTYLDLSNNSIIGDDGISELTNLKSLRIQGMMKYVPITDAALSNLTNLTFLDISWNNSITNAGLINLTNLEILAVKGNKHITSGDHLMKLRVIIADFHSVFGPLDKYHVSRSYEKYCEFGGCYPWGSINLI
ncbi:MAG: hypothetical protein Harvfovirus59_8 [Harvfovirus sp.]|uniref:Leucine-rich repeat protein n=1 Tax=Harvfovirus sp. TaxID=2487768 RepID=A0A3G5A7E4_9VIRU|nr:MAG: hypothetical protein Harvfovirus59_8 [Harvfovirus sp.]